MEVVLCGIRGLPRPSRVRNCQGPRKTALSEPVDARISGPGEIRIATRRGGTRLGSRRQVGARGVCWLNEGITNE